MNSSFECYWKTVRWQASIPEHRGKNQTCGTLVEDTTLDLKVSTDITAHVLMFGSTKNQFVVHTVPTIQIHNYTILNETWNKCVLLHSLYTSYLWPLLWWLSLIWGRRCHILPLWRPWSGTHKPYWASGCSLWLMWTWTSLWSRSGPSDPVQVINHILIKRKPPNIQLLCES